MNVSITQSVTGGTCEGGKTLNPADLSRFSPTLQLTKLSSANAAARLIMVGTIPNFPACKIRNGYYDRVYMQNNILKDVFLQPHSSKDNNIKPDPISFNQGSSLFPIGGLVVFCKPGSSVYFH